MFEGASTPCCISQDVGLKGAGLGFFCPPEAESVLASALAAVPAIADRVTAA